MSAGLTNYEIPGISGPDIQKELWTKGKLQPRSVGKKMVRHSTHIYNSKEQVDKAIMILDDIAKRA